MTVYFAVNAVMYVRHGSFFFSPQNEYTPLAILNLAWFCSVIDFYANAAVPRRVNTGSTFELITSNAAV